LLHLSYYAVSATHCVKDLYRVFTNGVIEYFNRVTRPVETNKAVFIVITVQQTGANSSPVGVDDVFPRYPMLERRRSKYKFRLHAYSIAQKRAGSNKETPCWGNK